MLWMAGRLKMNFCSPSSYFDTLYINMTSRGVKGFCEIHAIFMEKIDRVREE